MKTYKKREAFASRFCLAIVSQIVEALLIISSFYRTQKDKILVLSQRLFFYKIILLVLISVLYFNCV